MEHRDLVDQELVRFMKDNPDGVTHSNQIVVANALNQSDDIRRTGMVGTADVEDAIKRLVSAGIARSEVSGFRLN